MLKPITIVGGGLAGLSLGIGLRQRGVPVTLWEAGRYPRHRVCGEFISGHGQNALARLGLLSMIQSTGACEAKNAAFFSETNSTPPRSLPQCALCISRYDLDGLLAQRFEEVGGELRVGSRWQEGFGEGIVRASGRRVHPPEDSWRYFGLKVHASRLQLEADLELHFVPSGYVGLCRLKENQVNLCGLFRSKKAEPGLAHHWREWLKGPEGSLLNTRLKTAIFEEGSFCSTAGFSLTPQLAAPRGECCIGDALTMIPPLTGNGMSMAFESAELALEPITRFSQGELSWEQAREQVAAGCAEAFTQRLRWARWVQQCLFQGLTRAALLFMVGHSELLWRVLFARTR